MKILFICSGNTEQDVPHHIFNQGESLKKYKINLEYFPIKGKGFRGYFKNISILKKKLDFNTYDIIHAHYTYTGWVALLTLTKTPIILSMMGRDAYGNFTIEGKRTLDSIFIILLSQIIQPFMKAIIVKSENIFKYIYLRKKTYLIPNGIDFTRFYPMNSEMCKQRLGLPLDKKLLLFFADPDSPIKNFTLLKGALKLLKNNTIEIINPYPIKNEIFPLYLNACDVFVLTSYNEGSPNVIKEAMACNIPIVSTDVGDVCKVIANTEGCFLTRFTTRDVADKIKKALEFRKQTNGRENVKHLEARVIAKKIIIVYKKVLNQ